MQIPVMKWFTKLFKRSRAEQITMERLFGTRKSLSGVSVDEESALHSTTVYACIKVLSESIASLPLILYERDGESRQRAGDHPLYDILHNSPNSHMTSFTFREMLQAHILSYGAAYCEIQRTAGGQVAALWPLLPDRTTPKIVNNRKVFETRIGDEQKILPAEKVLHIPGLGFDGINAYSPIQMAMEAIGLGLAAEEFGNRFFSQGMNIGGIVEHPGQLSPEGATRLKKSVDEKYGGLGKSHHVMLLEEGMQFKHINITPNEAQFLESRKFQIEEIARIYRVPLHLLQELSRSTFSNIEHQSLDFVVHTLRPWLVRWEQAIQTQLLTPGERKKYFAEFLVDGLLRGDNKSRFEAYAIGKNNGWLSANDIRKLENMNPIPEAEGGDLYLVPLNMAPASFVMTEPSEPKSEPSDEPKEPVSTNRATPQRLQAEKRSVTGRNRIVEAWKGTYKDAYSRIVRREKNDLKRLLERKRNAMEFGALLDEFYSGKFRDYIQRVLKPMVFGLGDQVQAAAFAELGEDPKPEELQRFYTNYLDGMVNRYTDSSRGQLNAVYRDAIQEEEEPYDAVFDRVDEWEEKRPAKESRREAYMIGSAVAVAAWAVVGVYYYHWVTMGSDPCPICEEMNGRVAGKDVAFMKAGDEMTVGDQTMTTYKTIIHPPLHDGCVCGIAPGVI